MLFSCLAAALLSAQRVVNGAPPFNPKFENAFSHAKRLSVGQEEKNRIFQANPKQVTSPSLPHVTHSMELLVLRLCISATIHWLYTHHYVARYARKSHLLL